MSACQCDKTDRHGTPRHCVQHEQPPVPFSAGNCPFSPTGFPMIVNQHEYDHLLLSSLVAGRDFILYEGVSFDSDETPWTP